jgi:drug/metabolite transporter (DMT)-like permease
VRQAALLSRRTLRAETRAVRDRLLLLLGAALFSTGGAAIKATAIDGFALAGLRSGVAAVVLLALLPAARRGMHARLAPVAVAYAATLVLYVLANKATTSASAILLQSTAPLYLLLLGPFLLRERVGRRELGLFAAVAAGMLLCFLDATEASATAPAPALGRVLGACSGLTWALTLFGLRWAASRGAANGGLACVVAGNLLACAVGLAVAWPLASLRTAGAADVLVLGWLGAFQIGAAYVCVTAGLRRVPAFEASLLLLAEPVLNPIWAWLAHGERPGAWTLAAGVLILGASLLAARAPRPAPATG